MALSSKRSPIQSIDVSKATKIMEQINSEYTCGEHLLPTHEVDTIVKSYFAPTALLTHPKHKLILKVLDHRAQLKHARNLVLEAADKLSPNECLLTTHGPTPPGLIKGFRGNISNIAIYAAIAKLCKIAACGELVTLLSTELERNGFLPIHIFLFTGDEKALKDGNRFTHNFMMLGELPNGIPMKLTDLPSSCIIMDPFFNIVCTPQTYFDNEAVCNYMSAYKLSPESPLNLQYCSGVTAARPNREEFWNAFDQQVELLLNKLKSARSAVNNLKHSVTIDVERSLVILKGLLHDFATRQGLSLNWTFPNNNLNTAWAKGESLEKLQCFADSINELHPNVAEAGCANLGSPAIKTPIIRVMNLHGFKSGLEKLVRDVREELALQPC